jgi:hypothetical protein
MMNESSAIDVESDRLQIALKRRSKNKIQITYTKLNKIKSKNTSKN